MASDSEPAIENPEITSLDHQEELTDDSLDGASLESDQPEHLDGILSIKVPVIVKIAQKKMAIGEIFKFDLGTVIQFDQDAYQHVDLMVNNSTIGLGRTVKIGENFGLKITQIGDITDTIKAMKSKD